MKSLLFLLLLCASPLYLRASDPPEKKAAGEKPSGEPKWSLLGDDDDVRRLFAEKDEVVMLCVYNVEMKEASKTHWWVIFHATVTGRYKGSLQTGDRITVSFLTDDLPEDPQKRAAMIAEKNAAIVGSLRFGFLEGKDKAFSCEWLDLPHYSVEWEKFLTRLQKEKTPAPRKKRK